MLFILYNIIAIVNNKAIKIPLPDLSWIPWITTLLALITLIISVFKISKEMNLGHKTLRKTIDTQYNLLRHQFNNDLIIKEQIKKISEIEKIIFSFISSYNKSVLNPEESNGSGYFELQNLYCKLQIILDPEKSTHNSLLTLFHVKIENMINNVEDETGFDSIINKTIVLIREEKKEISNYIKNINNGKK